MKIGKNYIDLNVIDIYTEYLEAAQSDAEAIRQKEYNGRLYASGAGLCYRKFYYHENNMPKKKTNDTSLRTMRFGTVFGFDFERAISWYFDKYSEHLTDVKYYTEEYIYDDDFIPPIGGHFDILFVDESDKNHRRGYLIDLKTTSLWKFQKLFGKTPDKDPSYNYEMQLGTYAVLLERDKRFCDEVVYMSNVYFNKGTSVMKFKEAAQIYKDYAIEYWKTFADYKGEEPPLGEKVPFYKSWECNWCDYSLICESPHIKTRGK